MPATIQIRGVPEALQRRLKAQAALAGLSLSDYLICELHRIAERPTLDEMRARLQRRTSVAPAVTPAEAVRAARCGR